MSADQDDCMSRIEPLFKVLHDALHDGMGFYLGKYSKKVLAQHRDRTAANCVYDHAFHNLREQLDGEPGCHFLNRRGLEVLNYFDLALVRLKKVNGAGRAQNLRTKQQRDYDDQKSIPGLPDAAVRLIVGYQPDAAFSFVERVIVSRPLGKTIRWTAQIVVADDASKWFDITPDRLAGTEAVDFDSVRRRS
jgi:hypothetical protein